MSKIRKNLFFYIFRQSHVPPLNTLFWKGLYITDSEFVLFSVNWTSRFRMSFFPHFMYSYYLILLGIIRLLGVIIFFDYYRKEKRLRFLVLTSAFFFLALSPLIELIILDLSDIVLAASAYNIKNEKIFIKFIEHTS